jgi:quercetin dioxygenase-like cupin family protein
MNNEKKFPFTLGASGGKSVSLVGNTYRILAGGDDTNGEYAMIEMLVPPGGGPGPHAHAGSNETFYVIEGEVEVRSEAGVYTASKGAFINIPKGGIVHAFKNKTAELAKLLCTVVPAGLEKFFIEVGEPVGLDQLLPPRAMDEAYAKQLQEAATRYGQQIYPPNFLD